MKRFALLLISASVGAGVSGCGGVIRFTAVGPPPPPVPVVTVTASADPPPPVTAQVEVADTEAPAVTEPEPSTDDPDEVTASSEPPDPVYEEQTDAPGVGYVWTPGYWGWNGVDWGWNPGNWYVAPEGRVYVEPYYERVGGNVVYVRGYWGPRDAPLRSYGGERIRFGAAVRPADYRRGEYRRIEHREGIRVGARPGGFYEHSRGVARPLPRSTVPRREVARPGPGREPGRGPSTVDRQSAPREHEAAPREAPHEAPHENARPAAEHENARSAPPPRQAPPPHQAPAPRQAPHKK